MWGLSVIFAVRVEMGRPTLWGGRRESLFRRIDRRVGREVNTQLKSGQQWSKLARAEPPSPGRPVPSLGNGSDLARTRHVVNRYQRRS